MKLGPGRYRKLSGAHLSISIFSPPAKGVCRRAKDREREREKAEFRNSNRPRIPRSFYSHLGKLGNVCAYVYLRYMLCRKQYQHFSFFLSIYRVVFSLVPGALFSFDKHRIPRRHSLSPPGRGQNNKKAKWLSIFLLPFANCKGRPERWRRRQTHKFTNTPPKEGKTTKQKEITYRI